MSKDIDISHRSLLGLRARDTVLLVEGKITAVTHFLDGSTQVYLDSGHKTDDDVGRASSWWLPVTNLEVYHDGEWAAWDAVCVEVE